MARQAEWAKPATVGGKQVPVHVSVIRKMPPRPLMSPGPAAYSAGDAAAAPATLSGSRMTGAGVDGAVQPGKMAGQVHEGEGVLSANAMQNFTPQEFNALNAALESGKVNKNLLLQAIGLPTVRGYSEGGYVNPLRSRNSGVPENGTSIDTPATLSSPTVAEEVRGPKTGAAEMAPPSFTPPKSEMAPTIAEEVSRPKTGAAEMAPPSFTPPKSEIAPTVAEEVNGPKTGAAEMAPPSFTPSAVTLYAGDAVTGNPYEPGSKAAYEWSKANAKPVETKPDTVTPSTATPATVTGSTADTAVKVGLQNLIDQTNGMTAADQRIINAILARTDASNASNLRVLEHQISSDPELSDQGKRNAIAGLQRDMAADRNDKAVDFAISAADNARTAAANAVNLGQAVRSYEQVTLPAAQQNLDIQKRTFEEITLPGGKVNIDQLKANLGSTNWNDIQNMINTGATLERVNKMLTDKGMNPMDTAEYAAMIDAGTLGERTWNRQLTAANMLLTTPGENNKTAAAAMYSNIFPGVDFDFSEIVSMENSEKFSNGLSQMASYVATNADFDEVLTAMQKDGTLEMMGMDETQAAQLYNSMRVNALDAQWEEIETSDFYTSLLNSDNPDDVKAAADWKEFFRQDKLGMLDYDTLHEYNLYDQTTGDLVKTIYAKDEVEAGKAAAKNNLRFEDTGKVQFRMSSTIDVGAASAGTGITPTPSLEDQGTDRPVGEVFVEGGRFYEVDSGHKIDEVSVDPVADAWGTTGDKIIKVGATDNPFYTKIMDERAKTILDGTHDVKSRIDDKTTYDYTLSKTVPTDFAPTVVLSTPSGSDAPTFDTVNFGYVPEKNTVINYDGVLFKITSGVASQKASIDSINSGNYLNAVNLENGKSVKIFATAQLSKDAAVADGLDPSKERSKTNPWDDNKYLKPIVNLDYTNR